LYFSILILLVAPTIQAIFIIIIERPLQGVITDVKDTTALSSNTWFSGLYAAQKEKVYENSFGFRNTLIRTHNQIYYSLFNKAKANGVIVGKEGCLYELNYINAFLGNDYIGDSKTDSMFVKLKTINDYCNKNNKKLVLIFAPGKASYYPEYIPDRYLVHGKANQKNNYSAYTQLAHSNNFNFIDFNNWFIKSKSSTKHILYSKSGIHWSQYGSVMCADSTIKYLEKICEVDLNNIVVKNIETKNVEGSDRDIYDGMNLLFDTKESGLSYPNFVYNNGKDNAKKNAIIVADSYYWQWNNFGFYGLFKNCSFFYYNNQDFEVNQPPNFVASIDLKKKIDDTDVFIIMATEANLANYSWGFVESFYNCIKYPATNTSEDIARKLLEWKKVIYSNSDWIKGLKEESIKRNITLDSVVTIAAYWEMNKQKP